MWASAAFSVVARYPELFWPVRPDEAGFTLVARAWHPMPDSLYGTHFVDRPPSLIALVRLSDWLGGPLFLRVLGALACAALVLTSAACARAICRYVGHPGAQADRVAAIAAMVAAGLVGNAAIDPTAAKGEILGIPLVMLSCWLALRALESRSARWAAVAGFAAVLALGLKQNMAGGLVFGGVLLVGSLLIGRVDGRTFARLATGAAAGVAVPVLATVGWALVAGVHLGEVWFTIYGFRGAASHLLAMDQSPSLDARKHHLVTIAVQCGLALLIGWLLLNLVPLLRRQPVLTLATLATLALDAAGVVLSGSYWATYLFVLIPSVVIGFVLCLTCSERAEHARPFVRRWRTGLSAALAAYVAVASVVSLVSWGRAEVGSDHPGHAVYVGIAIRDVSRPGDSIMVYGGRADVVMASGLDAPYEHLWSLPMRTLDPDLSELRSTMTGQDRPTWFVEWLGLNSWTGQGERAIAPVLAREYAYAGEVCGKRVYRLRSAPRTDPTFDCTKPYTWADRGTS